MDSKSRLVNSAGSITCGFFSIIMIFFFIGLPIQDINEDKFTVIKGPRPYKMDVTYTVSLNTLNYKLRKREAQFSTIINKAANKHDVDPALIKAIIMAESGYDPMATSKRGAVGLMQLMPRTAIALIGSDKDIYNPVYNINAGVEYLKKLLNQFEGNLELTIAAYNAGSSKVRKYKGVPPYPATRYYVKKVFEYYRYYQSA